MALVLRFYDVHVADHMLGSNASLALRVVLSTHSVRFHPLAAATLVQASDTARLALAALCSSDSTRMRSGGNMLTTLEAWRRRMARAEKPKKMRESVDEKSLTSAAAVTTQPKAGAPDAGVTLVRAKFRQHSRDPARGCQMAIQNVQMTA